MKLNWYQVGAGFIPARNSDRGGLRAGINPAPTATRGQSFFFDQTGRSRPEAPLSRQSEKAWSRGSIGKF